MILYVQTHGIDRQWYKILDQEDLAQVYMVYPMAEEIARSCDTLKEAVEAISEYLGSHNMHSWVEDTEISKSLRAKATALGLALSTAVPAVHNLPRPSVTPSMHNTPVQAQAPKSSFGTDPNDRFLWNIKQIESSGGKNTNHKPIASGKFKGSRAVGQWGLLQPTIKELVGRMRAQGKSQPEYEKLVPMSRDQLQQHFQENPEIELNLARTLAAHVMKRQGGNIHRAAYSWLHGHNLHPSDINREKLGASDYVNKFRAMDQMNPYRPKPSVPLKKISTEVESEDFKMRVKNWVKRRDEQITDEPIRSSNFTPDMGRIREDKLDDIKPDSMKNPMEKLQDNIKFVNEEK